VRWADDDDDLLADRIDGGGCRGQAADGEECCERENEDRPKRPLGG
jgi:hypothetical protein